MRSPDPRRAPARRRPSRKPDATPSVEGFESAARRRSGGSARRGDRRRGRAARRPAPRASRRLTGRREVVRVIRACRSSASPAFCAGVAARLAADRAATPDLVRLLNAATGGPEGDCHDRRWLRLIAKSPGSRRREVARGGVRAGRGPPPAVERLRRALTQEAVAAGRHLTDLLGLVYDRQLMNRVGRVLEGSTRGDAGISSSRSTSRLRRGTAGRVVRALKSAFAPEAGLPGRVFRGRNWRAARGTGPRLPVGRPHRLAARFGARAA